MLDNPIWAFIQMAQAKEKNRQQAMADAQGIGQNLGNLGHQFAQQKAQSALEKALQTMRNGQMAPDKLSMMGPMQPTPGPAIQGPAGYMPPGGGGNMVAAGQQPMNGPAMERPMLPNPQKQDAIPDIGKLYGLGQKAYGDNNPFKTAMMDSVDPLKMAQAELLRSKALGAGGAGGTTSVWRNSATGEQTDVPPADPTGWQEYKVKPGQALQTLNNASSQKEKLGALLARTEAWNRSIDNKQINELVKRTGLSSKQQSALQTNNLRAARAIDILSKPAISWQELSLGEIDLAGIMQGGVPQVDEVASTHFPGWQEQLAKWKSYAEGAPTENVPEPIRKKVLGLVQSVIQIDNKFLKGNEEFSKAMLDRTIRGGTKQFAKPIGKMTDLMTEGGGSGNISSMTDDELRKLAGAR